MCLSLPPFHPTNNYSYPSIFSACKVGGFNPSAGLFQNISKESSVPACRPGTKYSNPAELIGITPLSPNVNVKQRVRDMSCLRFWCSLVHPSQRLEEENNIENWEGRGKLVQGFNSSSIYSISRSTPFRDSPFPITTYRGSILDIFSKLPELFLGKQTFTHLIRYVYMQTLM